jgi:hypothetical protein
MSSGAVAVVPGAVAVAAAAAVVVVAVAAVGAAVMVIRAANAAAEGAVRAVGDYGEKLEGQAEAQLTAEANATRWQCAAADVVGLNARIRMLRERAKASGIRVDIPAPLDLTGRGFGEVTSWARMAQHAIRQAQETLDTHRCRQELAAIPQSSTVDNRTAVALAAHRESLLRRYSAIEEKVPVPAGKVERALALLDPDANDEEHRHALEIADRVVTRPTEGGMHAALLLKRITQDINPRVARRRLAAQWLHALAERPVAAVIEDGDPPVSPRDTMARLHAVVSGAEDLTPTLRSEGAALMAWAEEVTQQRFLRDLVRHSLTTQGYLVDEEFDVRDSAGLRVRRADWAGEHTADVWVDRTGAIRGRVVREIAAAGDDAAARDRSRCDAFNDSLSKLAAGVGDSRTTVVVDHGHTPQRRTADTPVAETSQANLPITRHKER